MYIFPEMDQKYSDDGFTSEIPDMSMYNSAGPPPQLPVQLSRGILNAETDQSMDPTLLPEPQVNPQIIRIITLNAATFSFLFVLFFILFYFVF